MDAALLILRVAIGLLVAGHGAQKLFGWFGGHGISGTAAWLGSLGFRPAKRWAWLAGLTEFGGGLLLAIGLFSPLGSLGIAASMLTAIIRVHWPKVWVTSGGMELPLTNLAVAAAVGIAGPGAVSLDAVLGTALPSWAAATGTAAVLIGWVVGSTGSSRSVAQAQESQRVE